MPTRDIRLRVNTKGPAGCGLGIVFVALAVTAPSVAAKPITGNLSKPGYQVLALATDGTTVSAEANPRFEIRPPAKRVTLQLRSEDGAYAGPIVVGRTRHGRRAIVGVRRGARLGHVRVKPAKGYAKVKGGLAARWTRDKVRARARDGVPIGAGNFGRVRSTKALAAVPGDQDIDGVPNPLDVDPDGDLVLATATNVGARSYLELDLTQTTNANAPDSSGAPAFTDTDIDQAFQSFGSLLLGGTDVPADPGTDVELDCGGQPDPDNPGGWIGGLAYCTRGGTGTLSRAGGRYLIPPGASVGDRFPECCDRDGNGMGALAQIHFGSTVAGIGLRHGAPIDQVRAGDVQIVRFTRGGARDELSGTLPFAYATPPALASYSDTAGNCATAPGASGDCPTHFAYPAAPDGMGTEQEPFPVAAGSDRDARITVTIWRPQRQSLPGEAGKWIDTGHNLYSVRWPTSVGPAYCPADAYSTADPNLIPTYQQRAGLEDTSDDGPAESTNTLTFTFNLSRCVKSVPRETFSPGKVLPISIQAEPADPDPAGVPSYTSTQVWFKRH
jgi:hypothetical protein